jgi:uncharacterized heparinase superfamily protein
MPITSHAYAQAAELEAQGAERIVDLPEALGGAWVSRAGPRDLFLDAARAVYAKARDGTLAVLFGTLPYRWTLRGPSPEPSFISVIDQRPVRLQIANQLSTGVWSLAGVTLRTGGSSPWGAAMPSEAFAEELHGFSWLRHFRTAPGDAAQPLARALLSGWFDRFSQYSELAWRPHVLGRRLISWLSNGKLICDNADVLWRQALTQHLAVQARHLARVAGFAPDGRPRITAALGLALSGLCLSEGGSRAVDGLDLLARELARQLLPDGGHVSRDPTTLLEIFADLVALHATLESTSQPVPEFLRNALDRIAPMMRMLRHGDGRLALFNGGEEGQEGFIDALLTRCGQSGAALSHARHTGYHRLEGGKTIVIVDAGALPRGRDSADAHGGPLAFEMSVGAHRLVVNCGAARRRGLEWRKAARDTAAHSTLQIGEESAIRVLEAGMLARLLGGRIADGPHTVKSAAGDSEAGRWLWTNHDAYLERFELLHERRLFLDTGGRDLRGEDRLVPDPRLPRPQEAQSFALRFHLHPDLRASLARDGRSVLLMLPNGDGWRFRASGGTVSLADSIYLGRSDAVRKTEQIVVSGTTNPAAELQAVVKWAFQSLAQSRAVPPPRAAE